MAHKQVTVVARLKAKDGCEERVKNELMSLVEPTRSEPGCINYDLHHSTEDRSFFLLYENWKSKDDLDKHLEMPYLKGFMEKADEILVTPAEMTLWERIG